MIDRFETDIVTGGSGFIGTALVRRLLGRHRRVVVLDLLPPQPEFLVDDRVDWRPVDIRNEQQVRTAFDELGPIDRLYHLAARTGVRAGEDQAEDYHRTNVDGTRILAEAAATSGVGRVIFTSSSSVYGDARQLPTPESAPLRPKGVYASTKKEGEEILASRLSGTSTELSVARLFTVYGPEGRPDMAIPKLIRAATTGEPFYVTVPLSSFRDYTYIDDVVTGLIALADADPVPTPVNVATGTPQTLEEVIASIVEHVGSVDVRSSDAAGDVEVFGTWASCDRLVALVGERPTRFRTGIRTLVADKRRLGSGETDRLHV